MAAGRPLLAALRRMPELSRPVSLARRFKSKRWIPAPFDWDGHEEGLVGGYDLHVFASLVVAPSVSILVTPVKLVSGVSARRLSTASSTWLTDIRVRESGFNPKNLKVVHPTSRAVYWNRTPLRTISRLLQAEAKFTSIRFKFSTRLVRWVQSNMNGVASLTRESRRLRRTFSLVSLILGLTPIAEMLPARGQGADSEKAFTFIQVDYSHAASKAKKARRQVYNHDADASDPFRYYTIPVPPPSLELTFCPLEAIPRAPPPSPILLHPSCSTLGAYYGFDGPNEFAAVLLARLQGLFNAQQEKLQKQEELERQHWDRVNAGSWAEFFNLDYEG